MVLVTHWDNDFVDQRITQSRHLVPWTSVRRLLPIDGCLWTTGGGPNTDGGVGGLVIRRGIVLPRQLRDRHLQRNAVHVR